jgi:hypothetical protein
MFCNDHAEIILAAPCQMHRLIDEDARVEPVDTRLSDQLTRG